MKKKENQKSEVKSPRSHDSKSSERRNNILIALDRDNEI